MTTTIVATTRIAAEDAAPRRARAKQGSRAISASARRRRCRPGGRRARRTAFVSQTALPAVQPIAKPWTPNSTTPTGARDNEPGSRTASRDGGTSAAASSGRAPRARAPAATNAPATMCARPRASRPRRRRARRARRRQPRRSCDAVQGSMPSHAPPIARPEDDARLSGSRGRGDSRITSAASRLPCPTSSAGACAPPTIRTWRSRS